MEIVRVGREEPIDTATSESLGPTGAPAQDAVSFAFTHVPGAFNQWRTAQETADGLTKWGLDRTLVLEKFRFAGTLDPQASPESLMLDFFNDAAVQSALAAAVTGPRQAMASPHGRFQRIDFEPLRTRALDFQFFARLKSAEFNVLADSGYLRKCMDEIYDGATACNLLMDLFLNEESENGSAFSEDERHELMWVLLRLLTTGGPLSQPEENVQPYYDVLRSLLRALLHVVRDPDSGGVCSISRAVQVNSLDGSHVGLFPEDNSNNVCLLVFTPAHRTVTFLSSGFVPFFS